MEEIRQAEELEEKERRRKAQQEKVLKPPPLLATATSQDVPDDQLSSATIPPSDGAFPPDTTETIAQSIQPPTPVPEVLELPPEEGARVLRPNTIECIHSVDSTKM